MADKPLTIKEGSKLKATTFTPTPPNSLKEYNQFATFIGQGEIVIFKPDSIPELIKTIQINLVLNQANIDKNGLIWLVAPDINFEYGNCNIYIINPHSEIVLKSIDLPEKLRRPAWLIFDENKAYMGSDRKGFSVGIGSINRNTYQVEVLSELDTSGSVEFKGLQLVNENVYFFCLPTPRSLKKIHVYNIKENKIINTVFTGPYYTIDSNYLYTQNMSMQKILKLELGTLQTLQQSTGDYFYLMANDDNYIYTAYHSVPIINVYSKQNLEKVREILFQPTDSIRINNNFGYINDDLLMLNENSFYNVKSNKLLRKIFPLEYPLALSLMLAEK